MRNRAKCKLCNSILESFHEFDYVECKCKEISICGGQVKFEAAAKDWKNFMRVDDMGVEHNVQVTGSDPSVINESPASVSRGEKLNMLKAMIDNIEKLPTNAMTAPITHYDFASALLLILSLFKED